MEDFDELSLVNDLLEAGQEDSARGRLIILLEAANKNGRAYSPLLNHLVRRVGLYPYLREDSSDWQDRLAFEAFKVDVGDATDKALHREQSALLGHLLRGESVAVSAPTSFGKSFVIDAFISIAKPESVLIIVPTIALMDETRRRLYKKFASEYNIITTTDIDDLGARHILIFPQERAIAYSDRIENLDLFVVDEFYKASSSFDKTRSPALIRAILRFSSIARQRYFLAPNISGLKDNPFTKGMNFLRLDFNTVVLRKHDLSSVVGGDRDKKIEALRGIVVERRAKTLIYAGSHSQVAQVGVALEAFLEGAGSLLLAEFAEWLEKNYSDSWVLPRLIRKGVGLHNGQLHRSLSQIQVKLFEEPRGLQVIVSTSSIIEGVNTSAESVVLWSNKNGSSKLSDFDYRNIVGRSGRMFRHFVGDVYILESPPDPEEQQLDLQLPDALLGMEAVDALKGELSDVQKTKIAAYEADMERMFDVHALRELQSSGRLNCSNTAVITKMVADVTGNPGAWRALAHLNSSKLDAWDWILYRAIGIDNSGWDARFSTVVAFVKVISVGWRRTIPEQLEQLASLKVGVDEFFKLERTVAFKLSSLLGDLNAIHAQVSPNRGFDITAFVFRMSHAFLPPVVYQLEELGLPRMMSRKIHDEGIVDFESASLTTEMALQIIRSEYRAVADLFRSPFERYVLDYFIDGVTVVKRDDRGGG